MKKFFYMAVAAIAALSSCSIDEAFLMELGQNVTGVTTFTANIEDEGATQNTYNAETKKAEWEATTDKISIDGHEYTADNDGATTTFTGYGATESTHHAYFPASLYNSGNPTLPATQTYTAGKFNMPMYAESATTDFTFKNLCAVLAVTVTSDDIATLKSIKVKADKALSGAFTVSGDKAVLTNASDNTNTVELVSSSALTLDATGTTFYIAIPAQAYQYLNIYLSADGSTYKEAMATKKAAGLGDIARSKMYNINYEKNAVKLWAAGPYFAKYNVGVTDGKAESYGGYYAWGGSQDRDYDHNTGSAVLTGNNDTATKLWGSNWCMPKQEELGKATGGLLNECTCVWTNYNNTGVNGLLCTGKDDYASNSVFLPAAGFCDYGVFGQGSGGYWSSTPFGSDIAYRLFFYSDNQDVVLGRRYVGYSVRAVLAE